VSAIAIPWDPTLLQLGGFRLTWHSIFAVIGILVGVYTARRLGRRTRLTDDQVITLAMWSIVAGIVMARFLYVIDEWPRFAPNPTRIFLLNDGGITVWGAVIGGSLAVGLVAWWRRWPVRDALDMGAPGLILGMGIGRIGDLINGEHHALATDLPWAVLYTHPQAVGQPFPVHPATTYELLADLAIFGVALWLARRHMGTAYLFWLVVGGYSAMRFGLQFLRLDQPEHFLGLQQSQIIGVLGMLLTAVWLVRRGLRKLKPRPAGPAPPHRSRGSS
jgi:phosphatidylglycerol:prolipoprotein diacylglycerol transferase